MRPTFALTTTLLFVAGGWCACSFALDRSLDVSQYAHTAWKVRDGFAKDQLTGIAQTPDGYLWLGTTMGLWRFDGVKATPWQPPGGQRLPSDQIRDLLETRDGTLWISTLRGLASWRDGRLTQYPELSGRMVNQLLEDHEGTIWLGLAVPGQLCAVRGGKIRCEGEKFLGNSAWALFEGRKGELWVSSQTAVWRWRPGTPKQFAFPRGVHRVDSFVETDDGTLLLASDNGMEKLSDGEIRSFALPGVNGQFSAEYSLRSSDGSLWIGTGSGLLHVHQGRTDAFRAADGLSSDSVTGRIFEDREGNIWAGTLGGLDRFRAYAIPTIGTNEGLSSAYSWAVEATPDGGLWLATAGGLDRWRNGHVTVYTGQRAQGRDKAEHASGEPQSFGLDNQGRLWVSGVDGLLIFESGRFVHVPGVPGGHINAIVEGADGCAWISQIEQGLLGVASRGAAVERVPWARFGEKLLGAQALLADPARGGLWLGFYEGEVAYLKDGQIRASYNASSGLGGGPVSQLRFDSLGAVLAATEGGLSRIKDGRIETLNARNGLPCDGVHWSMEDDNHDVWVYMPCGLARIERSEWRAWVNDSRHIIRTMIFDISDGVRDIGLIGSYGPHVARSPDGKIWFANPDGVSVIDPHHLQFNTIPPPVHVESVAADGKEYDVSDGLRLPPHAHDLSIDYTALSLAVPEKVHFKVKLEGQDNDWRELVNVRHVEYTNLAPRNYRFRVLACNNSGVWNQTGDSFEFSIAPAYYQTIWFKMLCAAAFLALLWALYLFRLQQLRHQFTIGMEARVNERTRVARELHDTLLQSFQGAVFQFQAARKLLLRNADNTLQVMDEAIQAAEEGITEGRAAIQDLRPEPAAQRDLPELLNASGHELAGAQQPDGHSPSFSVFVEGKQQTLPPMLQDEVYRISREVIRNAFAHAAASRIEVEIRYDRDQLRVRVRDDGKGIDSKVLEEGGQPGHWGISGMRERAQRIGARLDFWSEMSAGTEVQLTIPGAIAYKKRGDGRRFRLFRKAGSDE